MEELKPLGKTVSEVIVFILVYGAIIFTVFAALMILIIVYNKMKKQNKENGISDEKKYLPMKISIYVIAGVLLLLISPIILIRFV